MPGCAILDVYGEVTEWLKVHAWKVCVRGNSHREFESHPLRQEIIYMTRRFGKLEAISFITGFSLMAYELVAARILAPSIGSSTYVWTSVIGVIIAALSLGYWMGGTIADKRKATSDVVWLLLLSAIMVVLTLVSYVTVLDWVVLLSGDPRVQAVLAACLLFAPASFLLGMISPYLAKLNITHIQTSGKKVASLSALNSVGGITGTFVTGFVLFGYIGARETLYIVVILLLAASWLLVWRYRRTQRIILSVVLLLAVVVPAPRTPGVVDIDTPSAHYQVITYEAPLGLARGLVTGPTGAQSAVYVDGYGEQVFWYTQELARLLLEQRPKQILMLGGGAFTLPQYVAERLPDSRIDVVEIDPELERISEHYFHYNHPSNVRLIFDDARTYVNQMTAQYDAIVVDVYGDSSIPFSLMTREFAHNLAARTSDSGVVYVNLVAGMIGPCRAVFAAVDSAYRSQFSAVAYTNESAMPERWANHIVAYGRDSVRVSGLRELQPLGGPTYTDNYAPSERLNFDCRQSRSTKVAQ